MSNETTLLSINGEVLQPLDLTRAELHALPYREIDNFPIVCATTHTVLNVVTQARGVSLPSLLRLAQPDKGASKSIYRASLYVTVAASDGYCCLFSWHELMNTPLGEGVIVLYQQAGQALPALSLLATGDIYTAPRSMREVSTVTVGRLHSCRMG